MTIIVLFQSLLKVANYFEGHEYYPFLVLFYFFFLSSIHLEIKKNNAVGFILALEYAFFKKKNCPFTGTRIRNRKYAKSPMSVVLI